MFRAWLVWTLMLVVAQINASEDISSQFLARKIASSEIDQLPIPDPPRVDRMVRAQKTDELQVLRSEESDLPPSNAECGAAAQPVQSSWAEEGEQWPSDIANREKPCVKLEHVCRQHCVDVYDYVPDFTSQNNCWSNCSQVKKVIRSYCFPYTQAVLRPCRCALDVCLMLDHSGALKTYTDHVRQAYMQIINSIFALSDIAPRVAIVTHAPVETHPFSDSPSALTNIINSVENGSSFTGEHDLSGSLDACKRLFIDDARPNSRRIAFTITDGADPANGVKIQYEAHDLRFDPKPNVDTYVLYARHPVTYWHPNGQRNSHEIGKAPGRFLEIVNPSDWSRYSERVNEFVHRVMETCESDYVYPEVPVEIESSVDVSAGFKIGECPPTGIDDRLATDGDSSNRCPSRIELQLLELDGPATQPV